MFPDGVRNWSTTACAAGTAVTEAMATSIGVIRRTTRWYGLASINSMAAPALKDVQARLDELREEVNHHLYRYHVLDDPEITDAAYDRLFDELKALEEEHPDLITPDSPTQRVGAPPSDKFEKSRHLTPMGSLDKVTTDEALSKWAEDVRKRLDSDESIAYVIEPKIDGSAINLVYERASSFAGRP